MQRHFSLYNAIAVAKGLTEKFSVNAELSKVFSKTDLGDTGKLEYDGFGVAAKFIASVGENAEFSAGLRLDVTKTATFGDANDTLSTFRIPVGIKVHC
ncbi:MAG: hypothetical protein LBP88_08420 [Treponema sp.]|jgi:hypothetical protein|nr:hypothetical protein [Treponema sp.]